MALHTNAQGIGARTARPHACRGGNETERFRMTPEREYRIFVRDLVIPCSIGAYPQERLKPQRVRFNVALRALWPEDGVGDDLDRVLNYKHITDGIRALVSAGHVNLVETLAERIAEMCLGDARIVAARVSVEQ